VLDHTLTDDEDWANKVGKPVEMTSYIDSDHAGDKVTRQSHHELESSPFST